MSEAWAAIRRGFVLTSVVLGLSACGEAEVARTIGAPCDSPDTCGFRSNAACIGAWPDGYCTEFACTPGSCEEGARCVTGISFPGVPFDDFCLSICTSVSDCRQGYDCVGTGDGGRVCVALPAS